jgi:PAS domain S-box-containing protein
VASVPKRSVAVSTRTPEAGRVHFRDARVASLHTVDVLNGRPRRRAQPRDEFAAFQRLHQALIRSSGTALQALSETARELFEVETAGISLLERTDDGQEVFRWAAIDGRYASALNRTLPRSVSPCGHVLARNIPLLLTDPLGDFPVYDGVDPPIVEALLAPFHADGAPIGTLWLILHRPGEAFDASDAEQLVRFSSFGSLGYHFERESRRGAAREASQRFLLSLSDRLRTLACPEEIKFQAASALGEHLSANRVAYAEDDANGDTVTIARGYTHGVSDIVGRHRYTGYGRALREELSSGRTVVRTHIASDPRLNEAEKEAYRQVELAALVAVPLVKGGRLVAIFTVQSNIARAWSPLEIAVIEATAERIWDSVERARAAVAQRAAEELARESAARFKQVVNVDGVGFMVFDPASGRLLDANEAFFRMFGYTRERVAAGELTWKTLTPPEFVEASLAQMANLAQTGRIGPYEKEYFRADGSRSWMLFAGARLGDGTVGEYCIDISDRKRAEAALRDNDQRKDEFLAMLAHELRNPLSSIANASELLRRTTGNLPDTGLPLAVLKRQTAQLTRLVDDLLDISRIARGQIALQRSALRIDTIIEPALESIDALLREKAHRVQVSKPMTALWVSGDAARLVQALGNVLHNAAKYTDRNGEIALKLEELPAEVAIVVRDNGAGISAELLPHVFDLFVQSTRTLDRSLGGLGIGLSVVKRLIEMHGGAVSVASGGAGRGATFTIQLPRIPSPQPDELGMPLGAAAGLARRILVVDDNEDSARSLAMLLKLEGHEVETVYSGEEALRVAQDFCPEVIFLDIGLPHMDGYEVARRLRRDGRPSLRWLVALTGYGKPEDKRRALEAGFDEHMAKPANMEMIGKLLSLP